ncbi:ead/Ea22-like family protein [Enterobacter hormaechei subsp. hoffmannii]
MSNIDKRALREAAEKALPAMMRLLMMPNDELFDEAPLNVDGDVDAANAFNLLAGPETVLALLDELEHYKSREERVTKLVLDNSTSWDELYKKLEAAEKRIAELETREVILPQRMDPEGYHIDEAYMVAAEDGEYLDRDEVIEAMRTAGIRINGEG